MKKQVIKNISRALSIILCAVTCISLLAVISFASYSETLNLANVIKNEKGDGYYWNNPERILTLDGFSLTTTDDFGLKLPENATVELVGTNRISAAKYALSFTGNVTFKGSGTLIIESDEIGIYSYSKNDSHKIRVIGGKLNVSGAKHAIVSELAEISVTGGTLEVSGGSGTAIESRVFSATGGKVISDGAIHATHMLRIDCATLEASAKNGAALVYDNLFETNNIKLKAGNDSSSLPEVTSYNGEKCVATVAVSKEPRASILFGDGTPITVDYILLTAAILLIAAAFVIPYLRKRSKTKKLYETLEAEKAAKAEAKKNK